jgi:hypothetical protein
LLLHAQDRKSEAEVLLRRVMDIEREPVASDSGNAVNDRAADHKGKSIYSIFAGS